MKQIKIFNYRIKFNENKFEITRMPTSILYLD